MTAAGTPVSSMLLVGIGSFVGSFGAVFLKAGSARLELTLRSLVSNWRLAAGILFFLSSSVFFVYGLRHGELSVLYPLVSLGYIWTLIWSRVFFREPITKLKLAGVALILIGVVCIGLGTPSAARPVSAASEVEFNPSGHRP